jgi:hypothetical protein
VNPGGVRLTLLHCHTNGLLPYKPGSRPPPRGATGIGTGTVWMGGVGVRPQPAPPPLVLIEPYMVPGLTTDIYRRVDEYMILSDRRGLLNATCPSWFPADDVLPWDERFGIDASIVPQARESVRRARVRLLERLEAAAAQAPNDRWVVGQIVRFALDQGDTSRAQAAVRRCVAGNGWCQLLDGYVAALRHDVARADSMFSRALALMPADERCDWSDASAVLDDDARSAYNKLSCAQRDSANANIWWLSDPLYLEPGNERRVEHFSRFILTVLRMGTDSTERWDLHDKGGGDAVREMLLRYGWPSYSWWAGEGQDALHGSHVEGAGRFTTNEYSSPRYHAVPERSALRDPWTAKPEDWVLSVRSDRWLNPDDTLWWPQEHFARSTALMQLTEGQTALFRRNDAAMFAHAANLDPKRFDGVVGDTLTGALVFSRGPGDYVTSTKGAIVGYSAVFRSMTAPGPQLASLELTGRRRQGLTVRTRFGFSAPPTLRSMKSGEIAISDIALVRPMDSGDLSNDPAVTLTRMFGTTELRGQKKLGVFWETYGLLPQDTIEFSFRIERHEPSANVLRRFGFAIGIGLRRDAGVTYAWKEPRPDKSLLIVPGAVPTVARTLTVDISTLEPGPWMISITVKRPGQPEVEARREFMVLAR